MAGSSPATRMPRVKPSLTNGQAASVVGSPSASTPIIALTDGALLATLGMSLKAAGYEQITQDHGAETA